MRVNPYDAELQPGLFEQWFRDKYAAYNSANPYRSKRGKIPPTIATLDFETDPFDGPDQIIEPFTVGLFDGQTFVHFWGSDCVDKMVAHIRGLDTPHLIYAHNGGKFDFRFLLDHIGQEVFTIGTRIVKCQIDGEHHRHFLQDSFSALPVALSESGNKFQFDYNNMKRNKRNQYRSQIIDYMKQDCITLRDMIINWRQEFGNKITMASAAMVKLNLSMAPKRKGKFRACYQRLRVEQDSDLRPFYYGGHVECFKRGVFYGDFKLYDIRSSYPNVMRNYAHPVSAGYTKGLREITPLTDFARINAWSDGALPLRNEKNELTFPRGIYEFAATGHEIRMALSLGKLRIYKVHDAWEAYDRTDFAPFIDYYWSKRQDAITANDTVNSLFWKLVMNGAYGKFAQNPRNFKDTMIVRSWEHAPPKEEGWELNERYDRMDIYTRPADPRFAWRSYLNVGTGASITGAARADLMRGLAAATEPLYCDTDSIICRDLQSDNGVGLGSWQLEAMGHTVAIAEKKTYAIFGDLSGDNKINDFRLRYYGDPTCVKMASKGVKAKAADILRICSGEELTFTPLAPNIRLDGLQVWTPRKIRMRSARLSLS